MDDFKPSLSMVDHEKSQILLNTNPVYRKSEVFLVHLSCTGVKGKWQESWPELVAGENATLGLGPPQSAAGIWPNHQLRARVGVKTKLRIGATPQLFYFLGRDIRRVPVTFFPIEIVHMQGKHHWPPTVAHAKFAPTGEPLLNEDHNFVVLLKITGRAVACLHNGTATCGPSSSF